MSSSDDDVPLGVRQQQAAARREAEEKKGKEKPAGGAANGRAAGSAPSSKGAPSPKSKASSADEDDSEGEDEEASDSGSSDSGESDSEDDVPLSQRQQKKAPAAKRKKPASSAGPRKRARGSEGGERTSDRNKAKSQKDKGVKMWDTLRHGGVAFPPDYKPHGVKMLYDGKPVDLTPEQEEVASMFAIMKDTNYATKPQFLKNFWEGFKEVRFLKRIHVGNFRVEPPSLFRGRGEHPKMGMIKKRIYPKDITINIGEGEPIPEHPYPGQSWKEVRHDHTVTWLAYWRDTISQKDFKYVFLGATSSFKAESDMAKYEKARKLKHIIGEHENVELIPPNILKFDFLGKDSIRYENSHEVDPVVYANIEKYKHMDIHGKKKGPGDQVFDSFDANDLNKVLRNIMEGLSVKVFRTYNASIHFERMLREQEAAGKSFQIKTVDEKKADYDHANKEVAIMCNHQRSVPQAHGAQKEKLEQKLEKLESELKDLHKDLKAAKGDSKAKPEVITKRIEAKKNQIAKAKLQMHVKEDLSTVSLGTSKINYMDPRITVAWCKRNEAPIEKLFNRSLLAKFNWAMEEDPDFVF
ncbi:DNA topoisomerase I [Dunaliella salina]|uniref:DNA topoisomerase 1 n=1 Tax=Dunaliella salina TaxID=3046 RepID=A0ABQ7H9D8_DUNSA|nr:DNA topoisomerase I [Dunaliella salina]|eukprot:KAF5843466.1 DNA topoisomerase I [Dunaliella salina]